MKGSAKPLLAWPVVFLAHAGLSVVVVLCLLSSIRQGAPPAESLWFLPALLLCPILPLAFFADYLLSQTQFAVVIAVNSLLYSVALMWAGTAIAKRAGLVRRAGVHVPAHGNGG